MRTGPVAAAIVAAAGLLVGVATSTPLSSAYPDGASFPPSFFADAGFLVANRSADTRLMYFFFRTTSRDANASKKTVLWLNGGPGCSDAMGLFYENGPFHVNGKTLQLEPNPNTWVQSFNVLYVDQPCGTGYSLCGSAGYATDEKRVTGDLLNALGDFFGKPEHGDLSDGEFYIMGESYAGKYIPSLAQRMLEESVAHVPKLAGIAIGNGMVDPITQVGVYADFAFNTQLVDAQQASELRKQQQQAAELIRAGKYVEANNMWDKITMNMLSWGGWPDPSDMRYYGFGRLNFTAGTAFLEQASVRAKLGVSPTAKFTMCNSDVQKALAADEMRSVKHIITMLLDTTDVKVLLYTGNFDPALPVPETWIASIPWNHQKEFATAKRNVWKNPAGATAGYVKQVDDLTFTVVVQAGHMAVQVRQYSFSLGLHCISSLPAVTRVGFVVPRLLVIACTVFELTPFSARTNPQTAWKWPRSSFSDDAGLDPEQVFSPSLMIGKEANGKKQVQTKTQF
jgi:vitellogenic carboxypeptidase-like protein